MALPKDGSFQTSSFSNVDPVPFCVAVARSNDGILVKHSKDATGKTLAFTTKEWEAFVKGVKAGEFDA
ncbi:MAG: DUF397 domain-containing protein [Patescibacteria group bacterium]